MSNRDYELHLEESVDSRIPLPVATTGVPQLRYCLSSLPAEDKLKVLEHRYKGNLRGVLDTMSILSLQTQLERRQEMRRVVEKPRKVQYHDTYY